MTVLAKNHETALARFVRDLGIRVRYKATFSVTDENLHEFTVEKLSEI